MLPLGRFVAAWFGRARDVRALPATYERDGRTLPATIYRPASPGRLPGWVVLHGLTFTGREHPELVRFVTAIAAAGNIVLVPDIPEWRELRVAPAVTHRTIRSAVSALHERDDVVPDRLGLFGFSFGATQALIAAADPEVSQLLRAVAAWGGYHDLHRLFVFATTGKHELDGVDYEVTPDPYGAWIMAGNYLTCIPGFEECDDVARAAMELARLAGRRRTFAGDPAYDADKDRLRETVHPDRRPIFDLVAPRTDAKRDLQRVRRHSLELADAVLRADPLMDPKPWLGQVGTRVLLAHGEQDRLIPFSETIRLSRALPADRLASCTITRLFAHSGRRGPGLGPAGKVRETARFLAVLNRILHLV